MAYAMANDFLSVTNCSNRISISLATVSSSCGSGVDINILTWISFQVVFAKNRFDLDSYKEPPPPFLLNAWVHEQGKKNFTTEIWFMNHDGIVLYILKAFKISEMTTRSAKNAWSMNAYNKWIGLSKYGLIKKIAWIYLVIWMNYTYLHSGNKLLYWNTNSRAYDYSILLYTVCPKSLVHFYIATSYTKSSWTSMRPIIHYEWSFE